MLDTNVLPTDQRARIERELFLRAMAISKPPQEVARQIAQILRDVYMKKGDVLFERGDNPKVAHFVVSGEITMTGLDEDDLLFGAGALIGILDLNIGRARARTAVCSADAHLLELPYAAWLEILEDFPDYTAVARRTVARGVHDVMLSLPPGGGFDQLPSAGPPASDCEVVNRIVMLRRTRAFEQATVQAVAEIAERGEILTPDPGELISRPGSSRARLFMVMRGTVHAERRVAPEIRATFGPGQLVLQGAAFCNVLSTYAIVAGANASVFAIDQVEIDDVADDYFDVARSVLRGMSIDRDQLVSYRAKAPGSRRSAVPPAPPSSKVTA